MVRKVGYVPSHLECLIMKFLLSPWYPGSGVVFDLCPFSYLKRACPAIHFYMWFSGSAKE